jgi:hypothetical protein
MLVTSTRNQSCSIISKPVPGYSFAQNPNAKSDRMPAAVRHIVDTGRILVFTVSFLLDIPLVTRHPPIAGFGR